MEQTHKILETPYGQFPTINSKEIQEAETVEDLFKKLETKGGTLDPVIFAELEKRNEIYNYQQWRKQNPDKYFADDDNFEMQLNEEADPCFHDDEFGRPNC